jgi:hypothetical protein
MISNRCAFLLMSSVPVVSRICSRMIVDDRRRGWTDRAPSYWFAQADAARLQPGEW